MASNSNFPKSMKKAKDNVVAAFTPDNRSEFEKSLDRVFGDITKASAAKQAAVGGGVGWVTGYLGLKIGKTAAVSVAASLLVLQVAQHKGLIKVDWTKVHHAVDSVRNSAESLISDVDRDDVIAAAKRFYNDNFFLAAGFTGGFVTALMF